MPGEVDPPGPLRRPGYPLKQIYKEAGGYILGINVTHIVPSGSYYSGAAEITFMLVRLNIFQQIFKFVIECHDCFPCL